jgi:hypothetical protein
VLSGTDKLNLANLLPQGCKRIVSMGLCGGIAGPPPAVADFVLASTLTDGDGNTWTCDPLWNHAVGQIGIESLPAQWAATNVRIVPWFSSGVLDLADTQLQRQDLFNTTGAWAIDDESFYAAKEAQRRGIMVNVARAVSDDASETLPLAARGKIINPNGSDNLVYLFESLMTEGWAQDLNLVKVVLPDYLKSLAILEGFAQGVVLN